jgi:hypothetical protein
MTEPAFSSDPLAELREQIRATTAAAARLAAEAADASERRVPPAGWATPESRTAHQEELQALVALVAALRDLVPDDLKQQVRDVLHQLLLLLRALVDWWVERTDGSPAPTPGSDGPAVQEIPID